MIFISMVSGLCGLSALKRTLKKNLKTFKNRIMKKIILSSLLLVASLIAYSQDVRVELLVHRDNAGYIQVLIEDYGNSTYVTMDKDVVLKVYSYSMKDNLFTYKISTDGVKIGSIYINLNTNRFTISLIDGTRWNADIVHKEQTI